MCDLAFTVRFSGEIRALKRKRSMNKDLNFNSSADDESNTDFKIENEENKESEQEFIEYLAKNQEPIVELDELADFLKEDLKIECNELTELID